MPNLNSGKNCCGCTACEAVCPKNAISMEPDFMGFKYPQVDYEKCIECKLCEKACSFNEEYKTPDNLTQPIPYGVRLKDTAEMMKSRSGGAFVAFSDWILKKGGVVYGAGYKNHFEVAHKRAANATERDEFRGSKYVQSDLAGIFKAVRHDLQQGLWVLFSGTPCQVAGLSAYIPTNLKEKLLTVDIVCHGVPSPHFWHDFLNYVEKKENKIVAGVDFRDKQRFGWRAHKETFTLMDPKSGQSSALSSDTYTFLFYRHLMLRPSCSECKFCNLRRPADLTLADFWGWEKTDKSINKDDKGISLILLNTPKGKNVFEETKHQFDTISPKIEDCMQGHLIRPTTFGKNHDAFISDYESRGFKYVLYKYGNVSWRYKIKNFANRCINKIKKAVH